MRFDLTTFGETRHARRNVHRVTEDVATLDDCRAKMQADANGHVGRRVGVAGGQVGRDAFLHADRGLQPLIGALEGTHDLVADGLDDRAAVALDLLGQQPQAVGHQLAGDRVAEGFVQPRAAADVGE